MAFPLLVAAGAATAAFLGWTAFAVYCLLFVVVVLLVQRRRPGA